MSRHVAGLSRYQVRMPGPRRTEGMSAALKQAEASKAMLRDLSSVSRWPKDHEHFKALLPSGARAAWSIEAPLFVFGTPLTGPSLYYTGCATQTAACSGRSIVHGAVCQCHLHR